MTRSPAAIARLWGVVMACPLAAAFVLAGCEFEDPKAEFDGLVDEVWMVDFRPEDAIEFLENGGRYCDDSPEGRLDKGLLLPLLKQIQRDYEADSVAIIYEEDPGWALAILIRLPSRAADRRGISRAIDAMDKEYPGTVDLMWGHKWLCLVLEWEEEQWEQWQRVREERRKEAPATERSG